MIIGVGCRGGSPHSKIFNERVEAVYVTAQCSWFCRVLRVKLDLQTWSRIARGSIFFAVCLAALVTREEVS